MPLAAVVAYLRDNAVHTSQPSMTPAVMQKHSEYDFAANLLTAGVYYGQENQT
ncbi:hypothetical protein [Pseudomonas brassicacearum]|uniref:hypothetical protein n=1 Tax=Pseudomonas brassicacearum TaxID=930166 RepID=UPI001617B08F|nr:hypothetical protein [Pseudomonas brassicacearum]